MEAVKEDIKIENQKIFKKICKKATKAINTFNMIEEGDRILVGLSGGKDSMLLMHVMSHLQRRSPIKFELMAGTFDPGFNEFNIEELTAYTKKQNWDYHVTSLDMKPILDEKSNSRNPCSLCSRIRRGNLHGLMDQLGCNKLVLAQHLDDICNSLLIGLFRGHGLKTMGPNVLADGGKKRLIRPFAFTPESWVIECKELFDFPQTGDCDYKQQVEDNGDRAFFARWLKSLETKFPSVRETMLASMMDVRTEHLMDLKLLKDYIPGLNAE